MRLIDADALKEKAMYLDFELVVSEAVAVANIDAAPTVETVKHGHWTEDHKCSVCHNEAFREEFEFDEVYFETDWCPYCGAKLDEEVSECD